MILNPQISQISLSAFLKLQPPPHHLNHYFLA